MSNLAIRAISISKRFLIDRPRPSHAMREFLEDAVLAPFRRFSSAVRYGTNNHSRRRSKNDKYIWALRNVSFEVKCGEVVGIIGSKGAGKSVLLKILSRITKSTEGYAEIYGKMGSSRLVPASIPN